MLLILVMALTADVWAEPLLGKANAPGASVTTVNYQGRLKDAEGSPLDGTYGMTFALYDAPTGGDLIWGPEGHEAVPVSDGVFTVGLGGQTAGGIPTNVWQGDRYLQVTVGGETLMPRETIRAVPVAGMALTVPDGSITNEKIADGAVNLRGMRLEKYRFWREGDQIVRYTGPSGEETSLNTDGCSSSGWCCNAENTICLYRENGEDAMLEFSLQGAPSYACSLLHDEDDRPSRSKGLYYAVDAGNDCQLGHQCARLRRENQLDSPITGWASYAWLCGW